jgi:uncharacterized membrane protein
VNKSGKATLAPTATARHDHGSQTGGIAGNAPQTFRTNKELRAAARAQLRGSYLDAVKITFVYVLPMVVCTAPAMILEDTVDTFSVNDTVSVLVVLCSLLAFLVTWHFSLGFCRYFLHRSRKENYSFRDLFDGFEFFGKSFRLGLLQSLFIYLWTLLLFIPGIIKACDYAMSFFIMNDNPSMSARNARTESKNMMRGHRRRFFCLCFSFLGWALLCLLSGCIGFLWLVPYMQLTFANFYIDIKRKGKLP